MSVCVYGRDYVGFALVYPNKKCFVLPSLDYVRYTPETMAYTKEMHYLEQWVEDAKRSFDPDSGLSMTVSRGVLSILKMMLRENKANGSDFVAVIELFSPLYMPLEDRRDMDILGDILNQMRQRASTIIHLVGWRGAEGDTRPFLPIPILALEPDPDATQPVPVYVAAQEEWTD